MEQELSSLGDDFRDCPVCMIAFRDPKVLPCGHTFCRPCVEKLIHSDDIKCPTCDKICDVSELRPDHTLNKFCAVLDEHKAKILAQNAVINATKIDVQSKSIELKTKNAELKAYRTEIEAKDVKIVNLRKTLASTDFNVSPENMCQIHRRSVVDRWCENCQEWICKDCCQEFHDRCAIKALKEVDLRKVNQGMETRLRDVEGKLETLLGVKNTLENLNVRYHNLATKEQLDSMDVKQSNQQRNIAAQLKQLYSSCDITIAEEIKMNITRNTSVLIAVCVALLGGLIMMYVSSSKNTASDDVRIALGDLQRQLDVITSHMATKNEIQDIITNTMQSSKLHTSDDLKPCDAQHEGEEKTSHDSLQDTSDAKVSQSDNDNITLYGVAADKQWKKHVERFICKFISALRIIKNQLWCCCTNYAGIIIIDSNLEEQEWVVLNGVIGPVYDLVEASNGDIVIATANGLFVHNPNGDATKIADGEFTGVASEQNLLYAAEGDEKKMYLLRHEDSTGWELWNKIQLRFKSDVYRIAISVKDNRLICGCDGHYELIHAYSLGGEMLQTYGTWGSEGAGQIKFPYLSFADDDGSVLIADNGNDRLQVMTKQGDFSVLQLHPPALEPSSAVLFNNCLYVTLELPTGTIYKYVVDTPDDDYYINLD